MGQSVDCSYDQGISYYAIIKFRRSRVLSFLFAILPLCATVFDVHRAEFVHSLSQRAYACDEKPQHLVAPIGVFVKDFTKHQSGHASQCGIRNRNDCC